MDYRFHEARYLFGFKTTCKDYVVRSHKFFSHLMKPDTVKDIIGDSAVFNQFFVEPHYHFEHDEEQGDTTIHQIVEYIDEEDDIETDNNETAFLIGFVTQEKFSAETLDAIYNELFIPLFAAISNDVKPTNRVVQDEDYILNRRIAHVGNKYIEKIDRREMNQERLFEVVAEGADNVFLSYHPEYKENITPILQAKNKVIHHISEGLEIARDIDNKKELAVKLKELNVLNFVMFSLKHNINNPEDVFKSLNIKTRIRAIEEFMPH